jgi:hypothetical protein
MPGFDIPDQNATLSARLIAVLDFIKVCKFTGFSDFTQSLFECGAEEVRRRVGIICSKKGNLSEVQCLNSPLGSIARY